MTILSQVDYEAAVQPAAALSDAVQAAEFQGLTGDIRRWNEAHKGENS